MTGKKTTTHLKSIADSILIGMANGDLGKAMVLTSVRPGEGKTTFARALAEYFGAMGRCSLVVEANRRSGAESSKGVPDFRELSSSDARDWIDRLEQADAGKGARKVYCLPFGPQDSASAVLGGNISATLKHLESEFDHIFFDMPAYHETRLTGALVSQVKDTLLVIRHRATSSMAIEEIRDKVERDGGRIVGAVLNQYKDCVPEFVQKLLKTSHA